MPNQSHKHHYLPQFFLNNFGAKQKNDNYVINEIFNK